MIKNLKEYKEKKKILLDLNKNYYDLNSPKVDDATYDIIKKDLISFEDFNNYQENQIMKKDNNNFLRFFNEDSLGIYPDW